MLMADAAVKKEDKKVDKKHKHEKPAKEEARFQHSVHGFALHGDVS